MFWRKKKNTLTKDQVFEAMIAHQLKGAHRLPEMRDDWTLVRFLKRIRNRENVRK